MKTSRPYFRSQTTLERQEIGGEDLPAAAARLGQLRPGTKQTGIHSGRTMSRSGNASTVAATPRLRGPWNQTHVRRVQLCGDEVQG